MQLMFIDAALILVASLFSHPPPVHLNLYCPHTASRSVLMTNKQTLRLLYRVTRSLKLLPLALWDSNHLR